MNLNLLPNALPNEKVVLFLRRHWIEVFRIFLTTTGLLLLPIVIGIVLSIGNTTLLGHVFLGPVLMVVLFAYLLIVLILTITNLTDYWLDVWIVTNERIINTEQHGLFNRIVSEVYLHQIQDITSEQKGFLGTFMTFGDVFIQTAAERERFQFKNIDNPDDVKIAIGGLSKICKSKHGHPVTRENPAEIE